MAIQWALMAIEWPSKASNTLHRTLFVFTEVVLFTSIVLSSCLLISGFVSNTPRLQYFGVSNFWMFEILVSVCSIIGVHVLDVPVLDLLNINNIRTTNITRRKAHTQKSGSILSDPSDTCCSFCFFMGLHSSGFWRSAWPPLPPNKPSAGFPALASPWYLGRQYWIMTPWHFNII